MSAFEFPFAVGIAVKKGGRDLANTGDNITEERISAGRAALSAVGNQMDGQNTLTFTARPARKPKKSWKNGNCWPPHSPLAVAA